MKYFQNCKTIDEVKATYKTLAKEHHPDRGGNTATMQEINSEYAFAVAKLAKGQNLSAEETEHIILESELYKRALDKIINIEGINIELVGSWIWVTGNTYAVKGILKDAGFYFASKKVAWYYRSEEYKCSHNRKKYSLDDIRYKYGSHQIKGTQQRCYLV